MNYTVLTEFRYDAGHAIAQSQALQNVTNDLAQSAHSAQSAFEEFGFSLFTKFNLPLLGAMEILKESVMASEHFQHSMIDLANLLGTVSKDSFVDRMKEANDILIKMTKTANQFGLPVEEMLGSFQKIFAIQEFRSHGEKGQQQAMDISRMFLKAAPNLGVNAGQAQNEMTRALQGQASLNDTLFVSLTRDTKTMAEFGAASHKWNALKPDQRIKLMTQALGEFSKDTAVLTARVQSLKGQFTIMKNNLFGPGGILTQFGEPLKNFFIGLITQLNMYLGDKGGVIMKNFSKAIEPWLKDPKRLFAGLAMIQHSKKDLTEAGHLLGIYGGVLFAKEIMHFFGISLGGGAVFRALASGLGYLFTAIGAVVGFFGGWFAVINGLVYIVSSLLAPLVFFYGVMQMISRAMAIAKINVLTKLANAMPMLTESFARFSRIVDVFDEGMNKVAEALAPFFEFVMYPAVNLFIEILNGVSKAIMLAVSGFQGLVFAIMEFVDQIKGAVMGQGFSTSAIGDAFDAGVTDMIERIEGKLDNGDAATKSTINMNVQQKFEFKQEMEPDRIAFTVKDQLMKIAQNPRSAKGMTGATAGGRL